MKFDEFVAVSQKWWNRYFEILGDKVESGDITFPANRTVLYPQILLCSEMDDWFAVELVGALPNLQPLTVKRHKVATVDDYFGQIVGGPSDSPMLIAQGDNHFSNLYFGHEKADDGLLTRFPHMRYLVETRFVSQMGDGQGRLIDFSVADWLVFESCALLNMVGPAVRLRWIFTAMLLRKSHTAEEYAAWLIDYLEVDPTKDLRGCLGPKKLSDDNPDIAPVVTAASFANIYLMKKLHETTIGKFSTITKRSFYRHSMQLRCFQRRTWSGRIQDLSAGRRSGRISCSGERMAPA